MFRGTEFEHGINLFDENKSAPILSMKKYLLYLHVWTDIKID